ncbi:MAG: hypothetical protein IPJ88_09255 [Myxococcales bacterium]|nr:MAG: hypothetical protein IPJ88_09255 [Myxococcales bacterium]
MSTLPRLPLPVDQLPEELKRFGDPKAPGPAKAMAAKGLVPVKGHYLVCLLLQLAADEDKQVAQTAKESYDKLPENILRSACEANIPAPFLDGIADNLAGNSPLFESLVSNRYTDSETINRIARSASEMLCERIAVNEQRLLQSPLIIETLYKNPNMRMSTADRLIDLAVRNNIDLTGIPSFKAHAEAIHGQLIPEASEEALPSDELFKKTLKEDSDEEEAIERDMVDGSEEIKSKYKPLSILVTELSKADKMRLAMVGNAAARSLLIRDTNKQVAYAAVSSPRATEVEAASFAQSREVGEEILRYIGNKREWLRNYEIKKALVFNSKTPIGISLRFLSHLRDNDLKNLSRSRNVSSPLKAAARQRLAKKEKR